MPSKYWKGFHTHCLREEDLRNTFNVVVSLEVTYNSMKLSFT